MHKCLSGTGSSIQTSSFSGAVGKYSSSSSSSSALVSQGAIGCSTGEGCSVLAWSVLLSIEELSSSSNIKWWCTVLRLSGQQGECAVCGRSKRQIFTC